VEPVFEVSLPAPLPEVPDMPEVPELGVVPVAVPVPVASLAGGVVVVPVPVASVGMVPVPVVPVPVAPVPVSPAVPLAPVLVLGVVVAGVVAVVSPVPVVLVVSFFLHAARLAMRAAAKRTFDAVLSAFIFLLLVHVYTCRRFQVRR
jgi:hypothetical protein